MHDSNLPVIDFAAFRGEASTRAGLVAEIGRASEDVGFFYLKNFGIHPMQIGQVFAQSRLFFALPQARKNELLLHRTNRGYDGVGAQSFHPGKPGDLKESFRFTAEPNPNCPSAPDAAWSFLANQPNRWPAELPQFRETMLSFLSRCEVLADEILAAIEEATGLPHRQLMKNHSRRNYTMRLLHYPAIQGPVQDGQERCGEHTDWGTITLLFQDGRGGLEVRRRTGEWTVAPPLADAVLVNVGDQLQALSAGRLVSTPHRVRASFSPHSALARYSVALFCFADFDAPFEPGDDHTSGAYVLSKLRETK